MMPDTNLAFQSVPPRSFLPVSGSLAGRWCIVVLAAFLLASVLASEGVADESLSSFQVTSGGFEGAPALTDQRGIPRSGEDFRGRVVVLSFGFTHCPDICPTTAVTMSRLLKRLGPRAGHVRMVFVSVDPERDTPEILGKYLAYFHPGIVGLSGSVEDVEVFAAQFFASFRKLDVGSRAGYLMQHTSSYHVADPTGRLRYIIPHASDPGLILSAIGALLDETPDKAAG